MTTANQQTSSYVHSTAACYPWRPRQVARHVALSALSTFNARALAKEEHLARPRVQFLCLHHLFRDEHVAFEQLLDWLQRSYTLISYSDAVHRIQESRIDKPYAVLSFDDGFHSCLRAGKILHRYDVRACFFLATAYIGLRDPEKVSAACAKHFATGAQPFMSWDDVEQLRTWGHEIGSHTHSHARLAQLSDGAIAEELQTSKRILDERVGDVKHFAWPFGTFDDMSKRAVMLLGSARYASVASAVRGCHINGTPSPPTLCLRRDTIFPRWPIRHIRYFLARNSWQSHQATNEWPLHLSPRAAAGA